MKKNIVGLTGLIGSGKSYVADLFSNCGVGVVDTDKISHELTKTGGLALNSIVAEFGKSAINDYGALNRDFIRQLVFSDSVSRQKLENILHPLIYREVLCQVEKSNGLYVVVVVPLLFKSANYLGYITRSIFVDCAEELLIERVMKRSGLSRRDIINILMTQLPRDVQLSMADDVLDNNHRLQDLEAKVHKLHQYYQEIFK